MPSRQFTPHTCPQCDGSCQCGGQVTWSGRGRHPKYCCDRCNGQVKAAAHQERLAAREVICSVEGCNAVSRSYSGRLCNAHYRRQQRGRILDAPMRKRKGEAPTCSVDGCERPRSSRGYCSLHYNRWRAKGDPGPAELLKRPNGTRTRHVDPKTGYVTVYVIGKGKGKAEHRHVMEERLGRTLLRSETVHHVNGITGNNEFENLELWASAHPAGQRVEDLVAFAYEILERYADELPLLEAIKPQHPSS